MHHISPKLAKKPQVLRVNESHWSTCNHNKMNHSKTTANGLAMLTFSEFISYGIYSMPNNFTPAYPKNDWFDSLINSGYSRSVTNKCLTWTNPYKWISYSEMIYWFYSSYESHVTVNIDIDRLINCLACICSSVERYTEDIYWLILSI